MVLFLLKKLLLIMAENRYVQSVTPISIMQMALAKRYRCENCECSYTLLSDSIFNSSKISSHKLMSYIQLMSFNVPLELICEVLDIASNTAELWRKKIFSTVDNYQDHLRLYNRVWIDETYIEDYQVLESVITKSIQEDCRKLRYAS